MGCVFCSLGAFFSALLNSLERMTLCTICAMLICCLMFTILSVLIMGIGIGFHYCYVQHSVSKLPNKQSAARSGPESEVPVMRSVNSDHKNNFLHRMTREAAKPPLTNARINMSNISEDLKLSVGKQNLSFAQNFTTYNLNLGSNFTKFPLGL